MTEPCSKGLTACFPRKENDQLAVGYNNHCNCVTLSTQVVNYSGLKEGIVFFLRCSVGEEIRASGATPLLHRIRARSRDALV